MDLAGLESWSRIASSSGRMFVRRHSTAAMTQSGTSAEHFPYDPRYYEDSPDGRAESSGQSSTDAAFMAKLNDPKTTASEVQAFVQYYRLPRSESAIHQLSADYPLSDTYTTPVYNNCIQQVLRIRHPGQSISRIVEMYNEMLQRDCRPSRKTYFLLIEAFANREIDVSRAVEKWELTKSRALWWSSTLGQAFDEENAAKQDLAIEGYKAEGNLANAFKIVRALQLMSPDGGRGSSARYGRYFLMSQDMDRLLLTACEMGQVTQADIKIVKELYMDRTREGDVVYYRALKMFTVLAKLQDVQGLRDLWEMFVKDDEATWAKADGSTDRPNDFIIFQRFPAYCKAAKAFFDVGEIDQGVEIFKSLIIKIQAGEMGNVGTYSGTIVAPLRSLIQGGRLEEFKYLHDLFIEAATSQGRWEDQGSPIFVTSYNAISDDLVDRGEWKMAYELLQPYMGDVDAMAKVAQEEAHTSSSTVHPEDAEISTPSWTSLKSKKEARAQVQKEKAKEKEYYVDEAHRLRLYAAILKGAAALVESDPQAVPAALALLPPVARSPKRFTHDDTLIKVYLEVLEKIGRYDLIPNAIMDFDLPTYSREPAIVKSHLGTIQRVIEADNLPLTTTIRIIYLMRRYVPTPTNATTARILADKYLDSRRKAADPFELDMKRPLFLELASDLLLYPRDEPEIDDALIQLMADFKDRFSHSVTSMKYIASHNSSHRMVERLMHRFGRERGAELACEGYGQEHGMTLVNMWERMQPRVPSVVDGSESTEGHFETISFAQDSGTANDPFRLDGTPLQSHAQLGPEEIPPPLTQAPQIRPYGRSGSGISFVIPPPPPFVASVPPLSPESIARPTPPRYDNHLAVRMHTMIGEAIRTRRAIPIQQLLNLLLQNLGQNHSFPGFQLLVKIMDALCREDQSNPATKSKLELQVQQIYALGQDLLRFSNSVEVDWLALENVMIIASCNFGHLEEAGLYRARIIQAGLVPSPDAYATMIASAKDTTDDAIVATQLWAECQAAGVKPHLYLYNTIISKLSKARKAEMALGLFEQMKAQRVTPSSVTYGAVIVSCFLTRSSSGSWLES